MAKKHLGQHFLYNKSVPQHILDRIKYSGDILEIGPGRGILSEAIIKDPRTTSLLMVELDSSLHEYLKGVVGKNVTLIYDNALNYIPSSPVHVISNLPYNISKRLIINWIENYHLFKSITIMVQKEVGDQLMASVGTRSYYPISILCQSLYHVKRIMNLHGSSFSPPTKVQSTVINMVRNENNIDILPLKSILTQAFQHRNKIYKPFGKRPFQLSIQEYIELSKLSI